MDNPFGVAAVITAVATLVSAIAVAYKAWKH